MLPRYPHGHVMETNRAPIGGRLGLSLAATY